MDEILSKVGGNLSFDTAFNSGVGRQGPTELLKSFE